MEQTAYIPVQICGTGRALPKNRLCSSQLDAQLGLPSGHLASVSGVEQRFFCDQENQIDLAITASQTALADANLAMEEIDLVLCASAIPYQTLPTTAPLVMQHLGMADGQAAAFDVNSTCLSFLNAFEVAANKLALGQCNNALVVSSEVASRALPWDDRPDVAALFGDGAAAAILTRAKHEKTTGRKGIHACQMQTFPSAYDACHIKAGGTRIDIHKETESFLAEARFSMDGRALFQITQKHFQKFVYQLLDQAGWTLDDIDIVIPHQASPVALAHMIKSLKLAPEKVINIAAQVGNQIAASIPFCLDHARKEKHLQSGMHVLLLGTSAGVSFGGMALKV